MHRLETRDLIVWSEGSRLAAQIIRPVETGAAQPAILLCHGWGGLKEHLAERYATPFAQSGYVCLVFDYRGWGGSDGRLISTEHLPMLNTAGRQTVEATVIRNVVDPLDQVADIRACLAWLCSEPGVDAERVGLWGSSYGGGHVIVVAGTDDRPKAVVAQIGGFGSPDPDTEWISLARRRAADKARAAIDPPVPQGIDAVPSLQGTPDIARQLFHSPINAAANVRAPTLFLDAEHEEYADPATHGYIAKIVASHAPSERVTYPCSHYDVYDKFYQPALEQAIGWYNKYLSPNT